jgi:hypothetical protein
MDHTEIKTFNDITTWVQSNAAPTAEGELAVARWNGMLDVVLTVFDKFSESMGVDVDMDWTMGVVQLILKDGTEVPAWHLEITTLNLGENNGTVGFFFRLDNNNRIVQVDAKPPGMESSGRVKLQ